MRHYQMLIGGEWVDAETRETFETENPFLGAAWAFVPRAKSADVDRAVEAARKAFRAPSWAKISATARGALLRKLTDLIAAEADRLAEIETRDNGKLITEMRTLLRYIPQWFNYFGGLADKIEGRVIPIDKPGMINYTRQEPLGVVAAITPWNSPLMLATRKLAPALAAGNTVVWKPSEFSSVSALEFGRLFEKAGFPPGVVNIVTGFGSELGERLVTHPDVAKIAFTGGDRTGQGVYELAARSIKPVTLELRGKSANIVFKDAALGTPGAGAGHSRSGSLFDHRDKRQGAGNRRGLRQQRRRTRACAGGHAYRQRQPCRHRRSAASTCPYAAATGRWAQLRRGRHRRIRGRRPHRPRDCDAGIRPNLPADGLHRPPAAAAACSRLLGLGEAPTASALSLAANFVGGQNQWPHTGADEMFFEAGVAARYGLTAAQLALGAYGSEKALDGEAGLLTAYRPDHKAPDVRLFDGEQEIMSVFFKPVPVCNFAQTPCLAAVALAKDKSFDPSEIVSVDVSASRAAKAYPGCDYPGPFARVLQAKMSIHYAVASALPRGSVDEASYLKLDDPALLSLAAKVTVHAGDDFTAAFPAKQGAEVTVRLKDGRVLSHRLQDVIPADLDLIRRRFRTAAGKAIGVDAAKTLEAAVDDLDRSTDVGALMQLALAPAAKAGAA